jgi:uncharacterized protein
MDTASPRSSGFIVKATRLCNLRCTYCHDWRDSGDQTMSFATLARLTKEALATFTNVDFIWHGGETTILPIAFYEKAMAVQARFRRPDHLIRNMWQTNGTLLDETWARFFQAHGFSVGISLDGPAEVHDRFRPRTGGQSSFRLTMRGLQILRDFKVRFGMLMVVDEGTLERGPDRLFDFLLEIGARRLALLAVHPPNLPDAVPGTPVDHHVDSGRMTDFLIGVYDRWLAHGDPGIKIRELENVRRALRGTRASSCTWTGGCLGQYFLVEPNGEVAHCDLFDGDRRYTYGNISQTSLSQMLEGAAIKTLMAENDIAIQQMRSQCPEFDHCNGGCPHDRYIAYRHDPHYSSGCCGRRRLIEYMRSRLADEEQMVARVVAANAAVQPPPPPSLPRPASRLRVVS